MFSNLTIRTRLALAMGFLGLLMAIVLFSFGGIRLWCHQHRYFIELQDSVMGLSEGAGVYFNGMTASHPALPFGGVKRSGYGRELSGHGIRAFCNATTVWYGR